MQLSDYCSIHLTGVDTEDLFRQYLTCNELVRIAVLHERKPSMMSSNARSSTVAITGAAVVAIILVVPADFHWAHSFQHIEHFH
eukprot:9725-Heterococcus_DN1.PRE.6